MPASNSNNIRIGPADDPLTKHIGYHDGADAVSGLLVHRRKMRVGLSTVTMGGIGGVGTDPGHRMKGLMRRVMDRSMEWMDSEGFDFSALFGIRDFYTRWGFATIYSASWFSMATEEAGSCPYTLPVRPFELGDMPAILRIYESQNRTRSMALVRKPFPEDTFRKGSQFFVTVRIFVVTTPRGRVVGYAAIDDRWPERGEGAGLTITDHLTVSEVGASDPEAYFTILAEVTRQARERGLETFNVHQPSDHPFAVFCRRWGISQTVAYPGCGATMACIINVRRALRKLRRELTDRCRRVGLKRGSLWLDTDVGSAALRLSRDGVAVGREPARSAATLQIPQPLLTQGLLGVRSPELVLADERVQTHGEVGAFAEALFMPHVPYMWTADHF